VTASLCRFSVPLLLRPLIADLVESGRQDVLEEAPDELVAGHGFLALAVGGAVLVAVGHGLVVNGQDAVVGDGDAEGVAGEIVKRGLLSAKRFGPVSHMPTRQARFWPAPDSPSPRAPWGTVVQRRQHPEFGGALRTPGQQPISGDTRQCELVDSIAYSHELAQNRLFHPPIGQDGLEVSNIVVRFVGIVALDGVSFDLDEGQILGLIGPNGADKITLFNCLSRLYRPISGDIRFEGRSLLGRVPATARRSPGRITGDMVHLTSSVINASSTTPVSGTPTDCWNCRIAASVLGPITPSTARGRVPLGNPL